ncbi:MAG: glycosyltransferase family 2 protein [Paracoccus sp. (in: a-proteobacteria)]|nr:glycosyltransferase family 2 protein [Paracoccus sp. (in: a-proteobacteria)]
MIADLFRQFKHGRRMRRAMAEIEARPVSAGRAHGLPGPLIVSLTSYPRRFPTLHLTLRAILTQTLRPDAVILWLAEGDDDVLPDAVRDLTAVGLEIATCPDWRSFKKLVPTLQSHPDAYVITADDDVYYPPDWIEGLVHAAFQGMPVACYRAHRVALDSKGHPLPYGNWQRNIDRPERGPLVFITGVSGVIYAPHTLHPDVCRDDLFTRLCPTADDVWIYWMYRNAGVNAAKIGQKQRILEWTETQATSLRSINLNGQGNDAAVAALMGRYGWPEA